MNEGRILEIGSHQELLALEGAYFRLYNLGRQSGSEYLAAVA
jgi:ABC-type multidrug transport system fused ATPase/permease subunit